MKTAHLGSPKILVSVILATGLVSLSLFGGHSNSQAAARRGAETAATPGDDPRPVYIESITYGGSGCPQGSVGHSFSNDRQSATLIFDSFVAFAGPGVPLIESRKNCQISVNLHVPQGWSCGVATIDYRGYTQLPAGAEANQDAIYYWGSEFIHDSAGSNFFGPIAKDYLTRDTVQFSGLVTGHQSNIRPLNINAQVRVISSQPAQITTDSIDIKVAPLKGNQCRGRGN